MTISQLKKDFIARLSGVFPTEEIQSFFDILSENYLQLSRVEIALNQNQKISGENVERFQKALVRLENNEPIQYIIGETEFYGLRIKVNPNTLIPRPETEELVAWILADQKEKSSSEMLDIGTGTGCIAIALAKYLPQVKISALDISKEALLMASENAALNNVAIYFFQTDILKTESLPKSYDLIVSNPPYVRELEKKLMHGNVLKHEPETALFVTNEDPLLFYRTISRLARKHLKPGGKLFFEINEYLAEETVLLLKVEAYKNIELKNDIFDKPRMVMGCV